MRICFLNHTLDGTTGAGRFGLNLVGRLRDADPGMEAVVLTTVDSHHPLEKAVLFPNRLQLLVALPRIRRVFRGCDLIHALDGWPYGVIAALAALGLGKKLVITAIGTGAIQPFYRWYGGLLAWAYRRADRLAAISSYTQSEILKHVPELDIQVINHAVDAGEFVDGSADALDANERAVIGGLKPYVLSVGAWKRRKGFEYSFHAFAEIAASFPELKYVVVGIGAKPWLTDRHGITGKVCYFKGIRWPFLKALYRNAELFLLLPYNDRGDTEGFGFAFLEAAAAGIPVIGTRESGAEDAVADGKNGFLVRPCDAHSAAAAAIRILSSPELRQRFCRGSRDFARIMNWSRVIEAYQKIYRELSTATPGARRL